MYDLHDLRTSPAFQHAELGLKGNFNLSVQICEGFYPFMRLFNFQILDGDGIYAVQIHEAHRPLCQCQDSTVACKVILRSLSYRPSTKFALQHIFWLTDQLLEAGRDHFGRLPGNIRLLANGFVLQKDLAQLIREIGLPFLGTSRGWNVRTRTSTGDGDEDAKGQRERLVDRVAVLNSITKPDRNMRAQFCEFARNPNSDVFDTVIEQFHGLVLEHTLNDTSFGRRMDQILTQSFTATARLVRKKFDCLEILSNFDATQSPFVRHPVAAEACAEQLRGHAAEIARIVTANASPTITWAGIGLLLDILSDVLERNYNMRSPNDPSANPLQNNLCAQLIASRHSFVVGELTDLSVFSSHALSSHRQRINLLAQMVARSGPSKNYLDAFQELLRHIPL